MDTALLSAIAAASAAVISLLNIGFTARLSQKQDSRKWTRDLLPEVVMGLNQAFHNEYLALFETDRSDMSSEEKELVGMNEFRRTSEIAGRLDAFASPRTIRTVHDVQRALQEMRFSSMNGGENSDSRSHEHWAAYWDYAEASHRFLNSTRREMGLWPIPVPPGLRQHRKQAKRGSSELRV